MTDERERRIRERAYAIWEREGRPRGREREHWEQAAAELAAEDDGAIEAAELDAGSTITLSPGGRGRRRHRIDAGAAASAGGGLADGPRRPKRKAPGGRPPRDLPPTTG